MPLKKIKKAVTILFAVFVFYFIFLSHTTHAGIIIRTPSSLGLSTGLISHWTFDGSDISGTRAKDISGNNNHGTVLGATKAIGKLGQALQFDGSDDYVSFSNLLLYDLTISTWIKIPKDYNNEQTIMAYRQNQVLFIDGGETTTCEIGGTSTAGSVSFRSSGAAGEYLCGSTVVTDGQWHHIVVTREEANQVSIIIDNNLEISGVKFDFYDRVDFIGASNDRGDIIRELNGLMDDVRVYNRILSANEIQRLYNMGAGMKIGKTRTDTLTSGLVGHWTFDGGDIYGTTALDKSGQGNNGIITGATKTIGKIGQGLVFNGSSGYINVSDDTEINPQNITMSAWVKTTAAGDYIIAKDPPKESVSSQLESEPETPNEEKNIFQNKNTWLMILLSLFFLAISQISSQKKEITPRGVIWAMALSGSAALIYEVAATQALSYFFGSSTYAVATVLVIFLFGLAMGSVVFGKWLEKIKNRANLFLACQLVLAVYSVLVFPQYDAVHKVLSSLYFFIGQNWIIILFVKFLLGAVYLILPTIILGIIFPLAFALLNQNLGNAVKDVAKLYSWDLWGAILGALVAGFWLVPAFGLSVAFVFGAGLNVSAGWLLARTGCQKSLAIAAAILVLFGALYFSSATLPDSFVVKDGAGRPMKVNAGEALFMENSPFGEILVAEKNDITTLYFDKTMQCGDDYPFVQETLEGLVSEIPAGGRALDVGLGCGFSARTIYKEETLGYLDVVDINPILLKTLKFFNNDSLLHNDKVNIIQDDVMHYLASSKNRYDFINIELDRAALGHVSPFYTTEYFDLLKQHLNPSGILRIWALAGNYEYVRAFHQTLGLVFGDDSLIIKTKIDPTGKYYYNTEFVINAKNLLQDEKERNLQNQLDGEKIQAVSTLDNQLIGQIWQAWSRQNFKDYWDIKIVQPEEGRPFIQDQYLFPLDVKPGDIISVGARIIDTSGIKSVKISFPHELGVDWVDLKLTKGTVYDGFWRGEWLVHDTIEKEYTSQIIAENENGTKSETLVDWTDPLPPAECEFVQLDSDTYSANVGATFSVGVSGLGCLSTYIEDNTGGSYATVPANDTDLDCNGDTCVGNTPFSKSLKCEAAGTYSIRAYQALVGDSVPSTVTCSSAGKSSVPYALSTVGGGQFLIMNSGTSYTADSSVAVNDGKWHHLVATYDGTTMRIYVDGVQTGSSTDFSGNLPSVAGDLHIGADYESTPGNFFNGSLDDVRVYDRVLSATEIKQLYNMGK